MQRATMALVGTVASTTLLVAAKYHPATSNAALPESTNTPASPTAPVPPTPSMSTSVWVASATSQSAFASAPASSDAVPGESTTPVRHDTTSAVPTSTAPSSTAGTSTSPSASAEPTSSQEDCVTATGTGVTVVPPGVGDVVVTIIVCDNVITEASSSISKSNWPINATTLSTLDTLAVQYAQTSLAMLTYSGATLTANAYQGSLLSAMTNAGIAT